MTINGLAVDLSIEEIHPELKDRMKAKFGYRKRSGPRCRQ